MPIIILQIHHTNMKISKNNLLEITTTLLKDSSIYMRLNLKIMLLKNSEITRPSCPMGVRLFYHDIIIENIYLYILFGISLET